MSEAHQQAVTIAQQAEHKLDYFMAGVAGTLAAYIGQSFEMTSFHLDQPLFELVAVAAFTGSFIFAIKRIESVANVLHHNLRRSHHQTVANAKMLSAAKGDPMIDLLTNELWVADELLEEGRAHQQTADEAKVAMATLIKTSKRHYRWRNGLLWFGFVALVLARLFPALLNFFGIVV